MSSAFLYSGFFLRNGASVVSISWSACQRQDGTAYRQWLANTSFLSPPPFPISACTRQRTCSNSGSEGRFDIVTKYFENDGEVGKAAVMIVGKSKRSSHALAQCYCSSPHSHRLSKGAHYASDGVISDAVLIISRVPCPVLCNTVGTFCYSKAFH